MGRSLIQYFCVKLLEVEWVALYMASSEQRGDGHILGRR